MGPAGGEPQSFVPGESPDWQPLAPAARCFSEFVTISGTPGKDKLYGKDGNDVLIGGAQSDFLNGGKGKNTLFGGTPGGKPEKADNVCVVGPDDSRRNCQIVK